MSLHADNTTWGYAEIRVYSSKKCKGEFIVPEDVRLQPADSHDAPWGLNLFMHLSPLVLPSICGI